MVFIALTIYSKATGLAQCSSFQRVFSLGRPRSVSSHCTNNQCIFDKYKHQKQANRLWYSLDAQHVRQEIVLIYINSVAYFHELCTRNKINKKNTSEFVESFRTYQPRVIICTVPQGGLRIRFEKTNEFRPFPEKKAWLDSAYKELKNHYFLF
jgi:hypothetical protein